MGKVCDSRAFSLCFKVNHDYHVALGACRKHKYQEMKKFKMKPKMLIVAMAVMSMLPIGTFAQEGLFQRGDTDGNGSANGLMNRSGSTVGGNFTGQGFGATNGNITGQTFGTTPLGSGLFVLLAAGAGYATFKSKKTQKRNQNRKGK